MVKVCVRWVDGSVCAYVQCRGGHWEFSLFFNALSFLPAEFLDRVITSQFHCCHHLPLPSVGIIAHASVHALMWVLGSWTQVLNLARQALSPTELSPDLSLHLNFPLFLSFFCWLHLLNIYLGNIFLIVRISICTFSHANSILFFSFFWSLYFAIGVIFFMTSFFFLFFVFWSIFNDGYF